MAWQARRVRLWSGQDGIRQGRQGKFGFGELSWGAAGTAWLVWVRPGKIRLGRLGKVSRVASGFGALSQGEAGTVCFDRVGYGRLRQGWLGVLGFGGSRQGPARQAGQVKAGQG